MPNRKPINIREQQVAALAFTDSEIARLERRLEQFRNQKAALEAALSPSSEEQNIAILAAEGGPDQHTTLLAHDGYVVHSHDVAGGGSHKGVRRG